MLAIHVSSGSFSPEWRKHCDEHGIPYKPVDCFADDIVSQLQGCDGLLWHWEFHDYHAALFARQLIASLEAKGMQVFPNLATSWHYDDKLGQKYLLEAIGAPVVPTHVFYDRDTAVKWLEQADFPVVWKLRGGAGSQNVRLVSSLSAGKRLVKRSFGAGWAPVRLHALRERLWRFRKEPSLRTFVDIGRGLVRAIVPHEKHRNAPVERNYVYFQEFIPENDHDIRVVVIGERAFAIKRLVRDGDFRASGSGSLVYEHTEIPLDCIRIAFEVAKDLKVQSCAFDFVESVDGWRIIEISYAFSADAYRACDGVWGADLTWTPLLVEPERFILEDMLASLPRSKEKIS